MKKQVGKKLSVAKATVSNLNGTELNNIRGGYPTVSCPAHGCLTDIDCTVGCPSINPRYCKDTACCCTEEICCY